MKIDDFNHQLTQFLDISPTPFHATKNLADKLISVGFEELKETEAWHIKEHKSYLVKRNDSSIIAFSTGSGNFVNEGFRMVGAHTDSPCLKVKPDPYINRHHSFQLGVEVYGGALLAPWFDRDLSLAGRISWHDGVSVQNTLIDFKKVIATVPSLAIHLDRKQNNNRTINPQTDIPPLLAILHTEKTEFSDQQAFEDLLKAELCSVNPDAKNGDILDFELFFYDTQPSSVIGVNDDFIAGARLDNLLSCFTGVKALIDSKDSNFPALLVCNDHEEAGSMSAAGAQGTFLKQVLQRIVRNNDEYIRMVQRSVLISADNAHALHPNFPNKHDNSHKPLINHGPVIKVNANQRYATTSETSGLFKWLCKEENIPVQLFVSRCDMSCGSTIGPITSSELGVKTLDVGLPTLGMHSIRELAGSKDAYMLAKVLKRFFRTAII